MELTRDQDKTQTYNLDNFSNGDVQNVCGKNSNWAGPVPGPTKQP